MVMSTQTLAEASRLLSTVLLDQISVYAVGEEVTVGPNVTRELTPLGTINGLVQTTTLENAAESRVGSIYSIKFSQVNTLFAGQAIKVVSCAREPQLVGKVLLIDKISKNGMGLIHKAVASDFEVVNQEGKGDLA